MRIKIFMIASCLILFLGVMCILNFFHVDYDNNQKANDLITKEYSIEEIQKLEKNFFHSNKFTHYYELKWYYDIQCLRKTFEGYYAILFREDGKRVFIFMNEDLKITNLLITDPNFKSKGDFENAIRDKEISIDELENFDSNYFESTISMFVAQAHIVKEGGVYILVDGIVGVDHDNIFSQGYYVDFDDIPILDDYFINRSVNVILDIDCVD